MQKKYLEHSADMHSAVVKPLETDLRGQNSSESAQSVPTTLVSEHTILSAAEEVPEVVLCSNTECESKLVPDAASGHGKGAVAVIHVRPRPGHHEHHYEVENDLSDRPETPDKGNGQPTAAGQILSIRLQIELSCFIMTVYGFVTVILSAPALYIWHASSLELFVLPNQHKLDLILLNTVLYTLYNGLLIFGILVTTPLFMSVGTMLVMPCSIVVDKLLYNNDLPASALAGAVVIVIGFAMLNIPQSVLSRWYVGCKLNWRS